MKNSWIENPKNENILQCFLYTYKFLFLKKTKISIFGGISKFVYGQILAVLSSFGQNLLHWQWLIACPNFG
jgi:hypothetical protein